MGKAPPIKCSTCYGKGQVARSVAAKDPATGKTITVQRWEECKTCVGAGVINR